MQMKECTSVGKGTNEVLQRRGGSGEEGIASHNKGQ